MGPNQSAATRLTRRRRTIRGRPSIRRARALAGKARPRRAGGGPEGRRAAPAAPASAVHCGHGARTPPGTGRRERRPVAPGRRRQIRALRVVGGSAFRRPLIASPSRSAARRAGTPTWDVGIRRRVRIPIHAVNRRSAGRPGRRAAPDPARALPRLRTPCLLCCIRRKWSDIVQGARRRAARPGRARRDARPDIPTRRDDALRPRHMARPMAGRLLNAGDRGKAAGPVCRLPRPPVPVARPDAA